METHEQDLEERHASENEIEIAVGFDQIEKYVYWRALGRPWQNAAALAGIDDYDQAKLIERSDDFMQMMQEKRESLLEDPMAEIDRLMISAIGIFAEQLQQGNIAAARDLVRARSLMGRSNAAGKIEKNANDRRSVETIQERRSIVDTARQIRSAAVP